jgi:PhnB protein
MAADEQGVVPMIAYADGAAAMDWLASAFGFRERMRLMDSQRLSQGEMETDSAR